MRRYRALCQRPRRLQALKEKVVFDSDGQLRTGAFQDYVMPRACDLPNIHS
jgi:CO/xanthine dehydrogenase Mo-binding subunit